MSPARFVSGVLLCALLSGASANAEKIRMHFDSDSPGRPPGFFDFVVWGTGVERGDANWLVLGDLNPPSTPNRLIQTIDARPAGSIAVALRRKYTFGDGEISVGLRKGNAHAGMVFRATGEKDFLLLLINAASGEASLSSHRGGKATELARGKATVDQDWGILSVTASGSSLVARWNGNSLLVATDPHPSAGRIGLATSGAGQASFDEFVFDAAPGSP